MASTTQQDNTAPTSGTARSNEARRSTEVEGYLPVDITLVRGGEEREFDLYERVKGQMVLLCEQGFQLNGQAVENLAGARASALYVPAAQGEALSRYAESVMRGIVNDDSVDVGRRSAILYSSARSIMADILDNPTSERTATRATSLARSVTDMILKTPQATKSLSGLFGKDYYTFTHSVHVCVLGVSLYKHLISPDAETLQQFGLGTLLHDVGKTAVDLGILNKPGKLSPAEFQVMRDHPTIGAEVLGFHDVRSAIAVDVTLHHHEKLDGSGYPEGLAGDQLTPPARIAAIADIYDALTTNRSYRKAMTHQEAIGLMGNRMVTTHLDAGYFTAFADMAKNLL